MEKLFIGNHIESGIVKFTELMQDVCLRLEHVDPLFKLEPNVLPLLDIKSRNYEISKETKEELMESAQKILVWYEKSAINTAVTVDGIQILFIEGWEIYHAIETIWRSPTVLSRQNDFTAR